LTIVSDPAECAGESPLCRRAVHREQKLDGQLEQRAQRLGDLLARDAEPLLVNTDVEGELEAVAAVAEN
jgi:hypothetical protein